MKRQTIGLAGVDTTLSVWTEGRNSFQLKRNETYLYAKIDLAQETANILSNPAEIQNEYNVIDLSYTGLQAIKEFGTMPDYLEYAGIVIGNMVLEGYFLRNFSTIEARNEYLTTTINTMIARVKAGSIAPERNLNADFFAGWQENILDENYYGNDPDQITMPESVMGLSGTEDTFSTSAKEGGEYWVYLAAKLDPQDPAVVNKILEQNRFLNWCGNNSPNLSQKTIIELSKSCIKQRHGTTPEGYIKKLQDEGKGVNGLGWVSLLIQAVIAVCALVISIYEYQASKEKTKQAEILAAKPTDQQINANAPSSQDIINLQEEVKAAQTQMWIWAGVAALGLTGLIIAIAKKNKQKKKAALKSGEKGNVIKFEPKLKKAI